MKKVGISLSKGLSESEKQRVEEDEDPLVRSKKRKYTAKRRRVEALLEDRQIDSDFFEYSLAGC